jgi:hypothetical protein
MQFLQRSLMALDTATLESRSFGRSSARPLKALLCMLTLAQSNQSSKGPL